MKITNINFKVNKKNAILSAEIKFNNGRSHSIYFSVDKSLQKMIFKDASPFLAASLAICMKKNEDIEIDGSVSSAVLDNCEEIMKKLEAWNLGFKPVKIYTKTVKNDTNKPKNIGCFFSGGADSFYTYLINKQKINKLIFVHGFDIKINNLNLYNKIRKNIMEISNIESVDCIEVKTNIRDTLDQYFNWNLAHPFALASISLLLRNGLKEIYMSCGLPNKNTDHHFLEPDLDILWSTETMSINHYGCNIDKIDKIKYIANFDVVLKNLRVCWVNKKNAYNCSECEKCLRNMLGLYLSDSLKKSSTFNKNIDLEKLKNVRINEYCLKYYKALLKVFVLKNDHSEIRFALEKSIRNNENPRLKQKLIRNARDFIGYIDKKYNSGRLYWFFAKKGLAN